MKRKPSGSGHGGKRKAPAPVRAPAPAPRAPAAPEKPSAAPAKASSAPAKAAAQAPAAPAAAAPSAEPARPRIFVSIAAYRDTECQWTVKDLFEKATHPERVFAGICWQFVAEEDADCFRVRTRPEQCRVIEVDARKSLGVGWARSLIQGLWQGEEYFFQIDAHSRFEPGWDEILIDMLKACPSPRAVLTHYPASYVPPDKLGDKTVASIFPKEFDERGVLGFISRTTSEADAPKVPGPTAFLGAGTVFAPAAVIREVPYDPHIYFNGEEITLAVRLWTHGWDLFTPNRVTVYHEYKDRPDKRRHWHDHKQWNVLSERAARRIRHLLCGEATTDAEALVDIERFGLGSQRALDQYEAFAKLDFRRRLIDGKTQAEIEAALPPAEREKRVTARFVEIWRTNAWGAAETRSGPGSTLAQTETLRARLVEAFGRLGIRTLVDAGCGELNWMSRISDSLGLYLGYDIVGELVESLRKKHEARRNHLFGVADVSLHQLPAGDAILCRDVLTHLSLPMVTDALGLFRKSGSRYLIATTFARGSNQAIRVGGWHPMDLCAPPFNLPPPEETIEEGLKNSVKTLGVWRLDALS